MIDKNQLIKIITESQKEKVDQEIEDDPDYKKLEKNLKLLLQEYEVEFIFEYIGELLIKTQDLAYKEGLEEGLNLKEIL